MNYLKIYKKIIKYRKKHLLKNKNNEKHHVIPSSLGGSNRKYNIVTLTPKEHYICHLLLTKIVKKDSPAYHSMIHAWNCMSATPAGKTRHKMSKGSLYQKLKREYSKARSIAIEGKKNPNYGKIWICNSLTLENKRINKTEQIPEGWQQGRNLNRNDYFYIINVKTKVIQSHDCNKEIPKGFILGRSLTVNLKRIVNYEKFKYSYDNLNEEEKKLVIINKKKTLNTRNKTIKNKTVSRNKYNFNDIYLYLKNNKFDFNKAIEKFSYKGSVTNFKKLLNKNIKEYNKDYKKFKDENLKNKYIYLYNVFKECNYNYDIFIRKTNYTNGLCFLNKKFKKYIKDYNKISKLDQNKKSLKSKYVNLFDVFKELNFNFDLFCKETGYNGEIDNLKRLFKKYINNKDYLLLLNNSNSKEYVKKIESKYYALYKIYKECNYDYDSFILKSDYKHSKYSKKTLLKYFTKYVPEYLEYKKSLAKTWNIDGHYYDTLAEANKITKISLGAIKRNSVNNVFNRDRYEKSCILVGITPKKKIS